MVVLWFYVVHLSLGGSLQARVARSLLHPPPIEQQRKDEWRISLLRFTGCFYADANRHSTGRFRQPVLRHRSAIFGGSIFASSRNRCY